MASNLCNTSFTWSSDRSPTCIIKFTYLDLTDVNEDNDRTFSQNERVAEDIELSPQAQLWLTRQGSEEDSRHCFIHLMCPKPEFAQINGVSIISESRTLEVSTSDKGYLTTVRGKKVMERSHTVEQCSSSVTLYSCTCHFEETLPSLSIKFLSLGERASFCVQSVKINVVQHGLQSPTVNGSLDVSKLKKDIEDMGSTMSERAKDFMTTLEQYEKNKLGKANGLLGSSLSSCSVADGSNGLSSIMNSILGAGTMNSLTSPNIGSDGDRQDLFSILNSVCGSVSSLRVASVKQDEKLRELEVNSESASSNTLESVDEGLGSQSLDIFTEKVERVKTDLRAELSEMRQEVLTKVEDVKLELNQKLDLILSLLKDLQCAKENT